VENSYHTSNFTNNENYCNVCFMDEIIYPIRLNRYLYLKNYCSRRQADLFIQKGLVKINGKPAVLGQKVEEKDIVDIDAQIEKKKENFVYFIFHKPTGIVTRNPQGGEKSIADIWPKAQKLHAIGALDKASEGLVLLTNDTRIVDRILSPKYYHEKEYRVRVDKEIKPSFKAKMERGVNIEGYVTKPCQVEVTGEKSFKIILTEGKKHQIRRMCAALGYQVRELKRTRIMNIRLGAQLRPRQGRELTVTEKMELLKGIGVM
jgi:23S rRNA pseudouridine2604 synthase